MVRSSAHKHRTKRTDRFWDCVRYDYWFLCQIGASCVWMGFWELLFLWNITAQWTELQEKDKEVWFQLLNAFHLIFSLLITAVRLAFHISAHGSPATERVDLFIHTQSRALSERSSTLRMRSYSSEASRYISTRIPDSRHIHIQSHRNNINTWIHILNRRSGCAFWKSFSRWMWRSDRVPWHSS